MNNLQNNQNIKDEGFSPGITKRQAYIIFSIISLALLMSAIDSSIVTVSLPTILSDLDTNLAQVAWVITGYSFSMCIVMPIVGKLSDQWGRKRLFMIAVVIFTVSSLAAGFAPNIYFLIVCRVLQGIGGGAFMPSAVGIISDTFGRRRATAIGLFTSIFTIGGVIGPNLGGFIVDNVSWRWIFFVNIPIGLLLVILGMSMLPKDNAIRSKHRIDVAGAGLFSGSIFSILYAMTVWANSPTEVGPTTWALFAVGIVLLILFVRQERRVQEPMIDLALIRQRPFAAANIYNFILGAAFLGIFSFIPYYATVAYGMTATESGIVLTPRSLMIIIFSISTSFLLTRLRYRIPMAGGAIIMSICLFLLSRGYHDVTLFGTNISNILLLVMIVTISGIGIGIANPASANASIDLIPGKSAEVTGLRGLFRITGGAFGTTAVVLFLSHFQDKAVGLQQVSLIFAIFLLVLVPITFMIPEMPVQQHEQVKVVPNEASVSE